MPYDYLNKNGLARFWNNVKNKFADKNETIVELNKKFEIPSGGNTGDVLFKNDSGYGWKAIESESDTRSVPEDYAKLYFKVDGKRNGSNNYTYYAQYNAYPNRGTNYYFDNIAVEATYSSPYTTHIKASPNSYYLITVTILDRDSSFPNPYATIKGTHFSSNNIVYFTSVASINNPGSFYAESDGNGNLIDVTGNVNVSTGTSSDEAFSIEIEKIDLDIYGYVELSHNTNNTNVSIYPSLAIGGTVTLQNNYTQNAKAVFKFNKDSYLKITCAPDPDYRTVNGRNYLTIQNAGTNVYIQRYYPATFNMYDTIYGSYYFILKYKKNTNLTIGSYISSALDQRNVVQVRIEAL